MSLRIFSLRLEDFVVINIPKIEFSIPEEMEVELKIYDVAGKLVSTLISARMSRGSHNVTASSEGFASGTYFYRLKAGAYNKIMKMSVIK